jgi:hypothetical protein
LKFGNNRGFCFSLGDQLAIGKETGRRLGMGTNMYPSSALLGQDRDASTLDVPIDELIEKADGFAGVFPGMSLLMLIWVLAGVLIVKLLHHLDRFSVKTKNQRRQSFIYLTYLSCFGHRHFLDTLWTHVRHLLMKSNKKIFNLFSLCMIL